MTSHPFDYPAHYDGPTIDFDVTIQPEFYGSLIGEPTVTLVLYRCQYTGDLAIRSAWFEDGEGIDLIGWHSAHRSANKEHPLVGWMVDVIERAFAAPKVQSDAAEAWREAHGDEQADAADLAYQAAAE